MREVIVKLYQFYELSDKAKEKARAWFRRGTSQAFGAFGDIYEPALTAAKILGIEFDYKTVQLMKGTRQEPDIRWSGFSSQGDGASFVGNYAYAKGCSKAVRAEFGTDEKLWAIADDLTALQRKHGYKIAARITQHGRYVHKYTMNVEVYQLGHEGIGTWEETRSDAPDVPSVVLELMRDFAQWIYDGLSDENDYQMSDEYTDDGITANEYDFREDGTRSNG